MKLLALKVQHKQLTNKPLPSIVNTFFISFTFHNFMVDKCAKSCNSFVTIIHLSDLLLIYAGDNVLSPD